MLSPLEQKTMTGERMLRRSSTVPSPVVISAVESLLPTKRSSTIVCISPAFIITWLPHQRSNSR